jgi:hypothetical protein
VIEFQCAHFFFLLILRSLSLSLHFDRHLRVAFTHTQNRSHSRKSLLIIQIPKEKGEVKPVEFWTEKRLDITRRRVANVCLRSKPEKTVGRYTCSTESTQSLDILWVSPFPHPFSLFSASLTPLTVSNFANEKETIRSFVLHSLDFLFCVRRLVCTVGRQSRFSSRFTYELLSRTRSFVLESRSDDLLQQTFFPRRLSNCSRLSSSAIKPEKKTIPKTKQIRGNENMDHSDRARFNFTFSSNAVSPSETCPSKTDPLARPLQLRILKKKKSELNIGICS